MDILVFMATEEVDELLPDLSSRQQRVHSERTDDHTDSGKTVRNAGEGEGIGRQAQIL